MFIPKNGCWQYEGKGGKISEVILFHLENNAPDLKFGKGALLLKWGENENTF